MATDGDIRFPPGRRREKPSFEPPPWERDQFEELARQKQAAEEAEAASVPVAQDAEREPVAEQTLPQQVAAAAGDESAATGGSMAESEPAETAGGDLDPKRVEMLMMGLRAEEPRPEEAYWKVTTAAGVVSTFIGLVVTTWGIIALAAPREPGAGAMMMVLMLLVFGIGFTVGGVWVVFNALRQRGVL